MVLSANLNILSEIGKEQMNRVIVELSVNDKNEVLTNNQTINTGVNVIDKIQELAGLGIKKIIITFKSFEGQLEDLPREQVKNIMFQIPGPIDKVIIACQISSLDDI